MKELKFRYVLERDGQIKIVYQAIEQLERSSIIYNHEIERWNIKARDLCTGLMDLKGVEIYKGDIIKVKGDYGSYNRTIEYDVDEDYSNWSFSYALDEYCEEPSKDWEVIGNIHSNPELLEK